MMRRGRILLGFASDWTVALEAYILSPVPLLDDLIYPGLAPLQPLRLGGQVVVLCLPLVVAFLVWPARYAQAFFILAGIALLTLVGGVLLAGGLLAVIGFGYLLAELCAKSRGAPRWPIFVCVLLVLHGGYWALFFMPLPPVFREAVDTGILRAADAPGIFILFSGIGLTFIRLVSYLHDRTWRGRESRALSCYLSYMLLPTQLWHGPIERAHDAADQLRDARRSWMPIDLVWGLGRVFWAWILWRFFASVLTLPRDSDIDPFANPDALAPWQFLLFLHAPALLLYLLESMFAHLTLGISRCFGFVGSESYNIPFHATSPNELWRRWNMTFSRWLRDYCYIPLGGSRRNKYLAIFVTFVYCGLLHMPQIRCLAWGLFAGGTMALGNWIADWWRERRTTSPANDPPRPAWLLEMRRGFARLLTFHWFSIGVIIIVDPQFFGTRTITHYLWLLATPIRWLFNVGE